MLEAPRRQKSGAGVIIGVLLLALLALAVLKGPSSLHISRAVLEEDEFQNFMIRFDKEYASLEEYYYRFSIYRQNAAFIRVFNSGESSFSLGINQFADMSLEEFKKIMLPSSFPAKSTSGPIPSLEDVPKTWDWREHGAVSPIKNQGQCGSCWSFSAAEAIEGAWFIAQGELVSLSEQELVDCSGSYGNMGCDGGLMDDAFKFVEKYGLTSSAKYPYTGSQGTCKESSENSPVAHITSYSDVTAGSYTALVAATYQQPVSVAVDAASLPWQFYNGGIIDKFCGKNLDHGVLTVGYDLTAETPYYLVKNSWGTSWGLDGYCKIRVTDGDGTCGIQMTPSYPIV